MAIRIGIIGLNMGAAHLRNLAGVPDADVAALADLDLDKARHLAAERGARAYGGWRAMLEGEPDLDAVILATPAKLRLEPIEAIARRGLALFCEKPPALDMVTAARAADAIDAAGILNTIGFQFRWNPTAQRLRELLAGRPPLFARLAVAWPVFQWVSDGRASQELWYKRNCGGPMIEQAIHYQDVLRYVTQDEPVEVEAMAAMGALFPADRRDCEETTALTIRHASGMLTSHVHNWSHRGTLMQMQLVGPDYDLTWQMQIGERLVGTIDGRRIDETHTQEMHRLELAGFVRAVAARDQSILRSPYRDALRSLAVCSAANEAIATGRRVAVAAHLPARAG